MASSDIRRARAGEGRVTTNVLAGGVAPSKELIILFIHLRKDRVVRLIVSSIETPSFITLGREPQHAQKYVLFLK